MRKGSVLYSSPTASEAQQLRLCQRLCFPHTQCFRGQLQIKAQGPLCLHFASPLHFTTHCPMTINSFINRKENKRKMFLQVRESLRKNSSNNRKKNLNLTHPVTSYHIRGKITCHIWNRKRYMHGNVHFYATDK